MRILLLDIYISQQTEILIYILYLGVPYLFIITLLSLFSWGIVGSFKQIFLRLLIVGFPLLILFLVTRNNPNLCIISQPFIYVVFFTAWIYFTIKIKRDNKLNNVKSSIIDNTIVEIKCPSCGYSNIENKKECPDCGLNLILYK